MNYIETGFCKPREFKIGKDTRIQDMSDDIVVNELYLAVFAFDTRNRSERVAKLLSRINRCEETESGLYEVEFTVHDIRNKPYEIVTAEYVDGLLYDSESEERQLLLKAFPPIQDSYFAHYEPDFVERELQAMF